MFDLLFRILLEGLAGDSRLESLHVTTRPVALVGNAALVICSLSFA